MITAVEIGVFTAMFCLLGHNGDIFEWYQRLITPLPDWLRRPLGGCYKCLSGQVCLWYYLFCMKFNPVEFLMFISVGILTAMVTKKVYCYLNE